MVADYEVNPSLRAERGHEHLTLFDRPRPIHSLLRGSQRCGVGPSRDVNPGCQPEQVDLRVIDARSSALDGKLVGLL